MSLITEYGAANRVIDTDLTVTYNKRKIFGTWVHTVGAGQDTYYDAWELTRYARKSYRYVGMTKEAANTCATAMVTKYTRNQKDSIWDYNNNAEFGEPSTPSTILMADIAIQHNDGCMYSVVVNVNETDTRIRRTAPASITSLFSEEDERDYDTATT